MPVHQIVEQFQYIEDNSGVVESERRTNLSDPDIMGLPLGNLFSWLPAAIICHHICPVAKHWHAPTCGMNQTINFTIIDYNYHRL